MGLFAGGVDVGDGVGEEVAVDVGAEARRGGVVLAVAALTMSSAESLRRSASLEVPKADWANATSRCFARLRGIAGPGPLL